MCIYWAGKSEHIDNPDQIECSLPGNGQGNPFDPALPLCLSHSLPEPYRITDHLLKGGAQVQHHFRYI